MILNTQILLPWHQLLIPLRHSSEMTLALKWLCCYGCLLRSLGGAELVLFFSTQHITATQKAWHGNWHTNAAWAVL